MEARQRNVLIVAILASFVSFLDGSIVNVALPAIGRELGGGVFTQQWVVDGYLLALGALILLAGAISDSFGRMRVLIAGLIGFGIASLACAVAPTASVLIAARIVQGLAAALLVPSSLALITSTFRGAAQSTAIGRWSAWTGTAFLLGPVGGGALVDLAGWRWIFAINVLPIAVTLLVARRIPEPHREGRAPRIDLPGAVLGAIGLAGPVFALIEQERLGWTSPLVLIPLIVGIASLAACLIVERRSANPMLPLGLFRIRNFGWGNLSTTFIYAALSIGPLAVTLLLQEVAGLSATTAGLVSLPSALLSLALGGTAGRLAGRYGARLFMTVGPVIAALGFLWQVLAVRPDVDVLTQVLPGLLLFAFGLAVTVPPLTSAVLGSIPAERSGIASAVSNAVSRIAGLIAVACFGSIVGGTFDTDGFARVMGVCVVLLALGSLSSFVGIRRPPADAPAASTDAVV